jgi:hypothetical protein
MGGVEQCRVIESFTPWGRRYVYTQARGGARTFLAGSSEGQAGRGNFSIHIRGATIQCCVYIPSANLQRCATRSTRCRCGERKRKREKASSFLLHALRIYTTCTYRPLEAKSRGAQQDPDATRCDDIVQCSASARGHQVQIQPGPPIQSYRHSTRVHVYYSHPRYCPAQDFIASPHVFPGRAFELHE